MTEHVALAARIVAAYVANNHVQASELPGVLASVHTALVGIAMGSVAPEPVAPVETLTPAQIRKSITPDALISFIDGKGYKTLKRHLTVHGHTPETYRAAFGLPADYPMVTASYAAQRSALAKQIGLGRPGARAEQGETQAAAA